MEPEGEGQSSEEEAPQEEEVPEGDSQTAGDGGKSVIIQRL